MLLKEDFFFITYISRRRGTYAMQAPWGGTGFGPGGKSRNKGEGRGQSFDRVFCRKCKGGQGTQLGTGPYK